MTGLTVPTAPACGRAVARVLYRAWRGEPRSVEDVADPAVLDRLAKQLRYEIAHETSQHRKKKKLKRRPLYSV